MHYSNKTHRLVRIFGLLLVFGCLCWYGYMIVPDGANEDAEMALNWAIALFLFIVGENWVFTKIMQKQVWPYIRDAYAVHRQSTHIPLVGPILSTGATLVTTSDTFEIPLNNGGVGLLCQVDVMRSIFGRFGKSRTQYTLRYLVVAIDLHVSTPHIFIDGRSQNRFGHKTTDLWSLTKLVSKKDKINDLEGDFYKYFDVYTAEREYLSALTIITPDVMLALRDQGYSFDYEIYNGHLYVMHEANALSSGESVQALVQAIRSCMDELIPQITKHTYHDNHKKLRYNLAKLHRSAVFFAMLLVGKFFAKIIICLGAGILIGGLLKTFPFSL